MPEQMSGSNPDQDMEKDSAELAVGDQERNTAILDHLFKGGLASFGRALSSNENEQAKLLIPKQWLELPMGGEVLDLASFNRRYFEKSQIRYPEMITSQYGLLPSLYFQTEINEDGSLPVKNVVSLTNKPFVALLTESSTRECLQLATNSGAKIKSYSRHERGLKKIERLIGEYQQGQFAEIGFPLNQLLVGGTPEDNEGIIAAMEFLGSPDQVTLLNYEIKVPFKIYEPIAPTIPVADLELLRTERKLNNRYYSFVNSILKDNNIDMSAPGSERVYSTGSDILVRYQSAELKRKDEAFEILKAYEEALKNRIAWIQDFNKKS